MTQYSTSSGLLPRLRWKRLLPALLVIAIVAALLAARPWQAPEDECAVIIRPGESIQAAIDAAEAGDVICLARGVWVENIFIDKSLTLVGKGAGRTAIEADRYFQPVIEVSGGDPEPVRVRLEGVAVAGDGGAGGVTVGGLAVAEITGCTFAGRWYGIQAGDSARIVVSDSTFSESSQRGVSLSGSARATISGSRISNNRGSGVWLLGHSQATFTDCDIIGNDGDGLWLRGYSLVELNNCSVSRSGGHGLLLTDSSTAQLRQGIISGNDDQGIRVQDRAGVEVSETRVLSNWHGLDLRDNARATVTDADISGNRFDGFTIQDSAGATISSSVLSANRRGLWVGGQGSVRIQHCLIERNLGYGAFSWSGGDVLGEGNRFRENGVDLGGNLSGCLRVPLAEPSETTVIWPDERYASLQEAVDALLPGGVLVMMQGDYTAGLTVGGSLTIETAGAVTLKGKTRSLPVLSLVDGARLRLEGVTLSGGSEGLLISAEARAIIADCNISGNSQGINLSYSSSLDMTYSTLAGNERGGISAGGAAQIMISRCNISDNDPYGMAVADFARATIADSTVTRNGPNGGIVIRASAHVALEGNTIVSNSGFGVALFQHPCFLGERAAQGCVSGNDNVFRANRGGDVCPPELGFLSTAEGGELDLRP